MAIAGIHPSFTRHSFTPDPGTGHPGRRMVAALIPDHRSK
ncbi:hypothetical protein T261_06106 [Streptomyces lydicus]|nr:hypothetical protein T261_06106 [Streptomyces lydicus]